MKKLEFVGRYNINQDAWLCSEWDKLIIVTRGHTPKSCYHCKPRKKTSSSEVNVEQKLKEDRTKKPPLKTRLLVLGLLISSIILAVSLVAGVFPSTNQRRWNEKYSSLRWNAIKLRIGETWDIDPDLVGHICFHGYIPTDPPTAKFSFVCGIHGARPIYEVQVGGSCIFEMYIEPRRGPYPDLKEFVLEVVSINEVESSVTFNVYENPS